jgi:hypothetical protein
MLYCYGSDILYFSKLAILNAESLNYNFGSRSFTTVSFTFHFFDAKFQAMLVEHYYLVTGLIKFYFASAEF